MDLKRNIVTLTTDFGGKDYFAGAMKGVMLGINPDIKMVDISNDVPSHDLWGAAYLIGASYPFFPRNTIHVVVVDPSVGSQRRPILAVTDNHYFIAPDNGVLSFVYKDPTFIKVIHITAEHYFLPIKGSTFHARDVFAPSAAWLSKGLEADNFGEVIADYARFNIPDPVRESDGALMGEVVYVDKFGNAITNMSFLDIVESVGSERAAACRLQVKDTTLDKVSPYYAAVNRGETGVVVNGNGYIEIFVNQGDARKTLGLRRGEKIKALF